MSTNQQPTGGLAGRRAFLKKSAGILAGLGAATTLAPEAQAAFGPGKVPTDLALSVTPTVSLNGVVTVTARLRRLDGNGSGLAGQRIQFYAGSASNPAVNLGYYWTNNSGSLTFTFRVSWTVQRRGTFVLIADMNPTGSEGWIANPRPYAWFRVV
jgi:hypothetical protein